MMQAAPERYCDGETRPLCDGDFDGAEQPDTITSSTLAVAHRKKDNKILERVRSNLPFPLPEVSRRNLGFVLKKNSAAARVLRVLGSPKKKEQHFKKSCLSSYHARGSESRFYAVEITR